VVSYIDVLAYLHEARRPRTYLEIGVFEGVSLRVVGRDTVCVGVDPEPRVADRTSCNCTIEVCTSDEFFGGPRPRELFGGLPIDLTFIDGMHLFEFALRDFMQAEALSGPGSLVVVHDCLPRDAVTSTRIRGTEFWTGDVWKLALCLLDHRPDLELSIVDVPPSGLLLVGDLDPTSRTLSSGYESLVEEYVPLEFGQWEARRQDVLARARPLEPLGWEMYRRAVEALELSLAAQADLGQRVQDLEQRVRAFEQSASWRWTAPIRAARWQVQRLNRSESAIHLRREAGRLARRVAPAFADRGRRTHRNDP